MERKDSIDAFGAIALISFSALLGLNQALVKLVNVGLDPVFQAGLRSMCAFFPILIFSLLTRKRLSLTDGSLVAGILCGMVFAVEFIVLFIALDYTSVSRASIFFYTMPFWFAFGAHYLIPGEQLTLNKLLGMLLAFAGVVIVLLDDSAPGSDNALLGDLLCIVAGSFWALVSLLARASKMSRSVPEMQLLYQLGVSAPIILGVAMLNGDLLREPTALIWGIFSFQVLVVVAIGFLSWFWLLTIYPAADMAVFTFLAPVFGVASGWLVLHEELTLALFVALFMVVAGIVLVNKKPRSSPVASTGESEV